MINVREDKGVCYQKELGKKKAYDDSRKVEGSCQGQGFVLEAAGNNEIQPRESDRGNSLEYCRDEGAGSGTCRVIIEIRGSVRRSATT